MAILLGSLLYSGLLIGQIAAHSWIACTDYLEKNGDYWDASSCRAFARHGWQYTNKNEAFGTDKGYNINNPPPPNNNPCRTSRDDNGAYTSDHPMAVYHLGQEVIIAHPTKNHVADVGCTNKYIPDNGSFIYRSGVYPSQDPTLSQFKANEVADFGKAPFGHHIPDHVTRTYPKPGYQNAPKFCENPDKSLATNHFTIPNNLQPGRYTLLWAWYFNGPTELYTCCWEVDIVNTQAERDQRLQARGISTQDPVDMHPAVPQTGSDELP